jgi:hypothetical protein
VSGTKNLQLARSLGARQVIDYTAEYFTGNGRTYDVNYAPTTSTTMTPEPLVTTAGSSRPVRAENLVHVMRPVDIR